MSWKPEVFVGGAWAGNGLRFATRQEALDNAQNLSLRWVLIDDFRAVESEDQPNYCWLAGIGLRRIDGAPL